MVAYPRKFQIMFLGSTKDNNNITFVTESKRTKSINEVKFCKSSLTTNLEL